MTGKRVHKSITAKRLEALVMETMFGTADTGICIACGEEQGGCEPAARNYECEGCEQPKVFGVEELMVCGWFHGEAF